MNTIRSSEDSAVRFAKLTAELFYFMAEEAAERFGEEGKKSVREAVRKFGLQRVADMKEEAKERGLNPDDPRTYSAVRDMPSNGWKSDPKKPMVTTGCPMAEMWERFGKRGRELGALYCKVDHTLFEGFGLKLDRPLCKTNGDAVCDFRVSLKPEEFK